MGELYNMKAVFQNLLESPLSHFQNIGGRERAAEKIDQSSDVFQKQSFITK